MSKRYGTIRISAVLILACSALAVGRSAYAQERQTIKSVTASSCLTEKGMAHRPENAFDGDDSTVWADGNRDWLGVGEWIRVEFPCAAELSAIEMINGYNRVSGAYGDLYPLNGAPKTVRLEYDTGGSETATFDHKKGWQKASLQAARGVSRVKLVIMDEYPGGRWKDTCIAEIRFIGKSGCGSGEGRTLGGFVDLRDIVIDALFDIRYATTNNFVGEVLDGYIAPKALMMPAPAQALKRVQDKLKTLGYRIKVFDAYRPMRAEHHMIRWSKSSDEGRNAFNGGYIASHVDPKRRVGHTCGNTVDLTIVDASGRELDMGTTFDQFDKKSWTLNITGNALKNRLILKKVMESEGFENYRLEWWHYTYPKNPGIARDMPIR